MRSSDVAKPSAVFQFVFRPETKHARTAHTTGGERGAGGDRALRGRGCFLGARQSTSKHTTPLSSKRRHETVSLLESASHPVPCLALVRGAKGSSYCCFFCRCRRLLSGARRGKRGGVVFCTWKKEVGGDPLFSGKGAVAS